MNTAGLVFALLTTLSWSIGIFPFTVAARRLGANPLNHFRLPLAAMLIFIIAAVAPGSGGISRLFSEGIWQAWWWLGLSGLIGLTVGDHFGFGAFAILGPRLGSVLSTFAPGAALCTGYFLTDDRLSVTGMLGMAVTMFGVMVLSLGREERSSLPQSPHGSLPKGILFGILAAFCQGAGLVLAKKGMMSVDGGLAPFQATFIRLSAAAVTLFLFSILTGRLGEVLIPVRQNRESGLRFAVLGTLFGPVIGVSLSLFTVSYLDASVAQTVFSLVPVVTLVISAIIHREPLRMKMVAGVLVAVAGVVVLVWRDAIEQFIFR
ncbi:MAG: hypothetical protein RL213_1737 [Bacteroidota bacterium]|jgi:drug/metabolite transporter (DMT)-like permease